MLTTSRGLGFLSGLAALAGTFADAKKDRTVAKVIKLLEDMEAELTADAKDDDAVYEKLSCWCKKNEKEKSKVVTVTATEIENLKGTIGEEYGAMKEFQAKKNAQYDENKQNRERLQTANELRMSKHASFQEQNKDMLSTVQALEQAITILSEHHPGAGDASFFQTSSQQQFKRASQKILSSPLLAANPKALAFVALFKQFVQTTTNAASSSSFLQQSPAYQSYYAQSGKILGMLKQMHEDFNEQLKEAVSEEEHEAKAFAEFKKAAEEQIAAGNEQFENFRSSLAQAKKKHAEAVEDLADAEETLSNAQEFLAVLDKKCTQSTADYERRRKSRTEELAAISETIKILDTDQAFEVFEKTSVTSLLQLRAVTTRKSMRDVSHILAQHASSPKFVLLQSLVKLNAFTKVKEAIDKMIAELKKVQAEAVEHRDYCIAELQDNKLATEDGSHRHAVLKTKIAVMEQEIAALTSEIEGHDASIQAGLDSAEEAASTRGKENAEFQKSIQDQRLTIDILSKAKLRMQQKYDQETLRLSMLASQQPGGSHMDFGPTRVAPGTGPAAFKPSGDSVHAGGAKIVQLLTTIIDSARAAEKDLVTNESDATVAYESMMRENNKAIAGDRRAKADKESRRAAKSKQKVAAEKQLQATGEEVMGLTEMNKAIRENCNFIMTEFETRQATRTSEMEALASAKAVLSGMAHP